MNSVFLGIIAGATFMIMIHVVNMAYHTKKIRESAERMEETWLSRMLRS